MQAVGDSTFRTLVKLERDRFSPAQEIQSIGWAGNETLYVVVEEPRLVARLETRRTRLFAVSLEGGGLRYLGESWTDEGWIADQGNLISSLPQDPDHILLSLRLPKASYPDALRVDVHDGSLAMAEPAIYGVVWWHADHRHRIRAATGWAKPRGGITDQELSQFILARRDPSAKLEEIARWNPLEEDGLHFASFTPDPETIYVVAPIEPGGRDAIYELDLTTKARGRLVFEHPDHDVSRVATSKVDGRPIYVVYVTERRELHFLDPVWRRIQEQLDAALPDRINTVISRSQDETKLVVWSGSDVVPPEYYLFDRANRSLSLIVEAYPDLESAELAPMQPVAYAARDGLTIHGYVTTPAGAAKPMATIVLPHGGPWTRDVWGWDPLVQFLASRGFAVFQPNFRGSYGYGGDFENAGDGEWGLAMQDDITDGVQWLIDQGVADPDRIGIFGISYGGYAALQGLVSTPELYRAGASYAGVTDLRLFMSNVNLRLRHVEVMETLVGDRRHDEARLNATSPAKNADRIRVPVLLGHGTRDDTVSISQSEAMARSLRRAGVPVELHIYDDELHWFLDDRKQADFLTKVADFFTRHLSP